MDLDSLSNRYTGRVAGRYDENRGNLAKWQRESELVDTLLSRFGPGTRVIDVPVGTGRFIPTYSRLSFDATGVDASSDMLDEARKKVAGLGYSMTLRRGDIFALDFPDEAFDICVCIRFLNWLSPADLSRAVAELARVTRSSLILGIRHWVPLSKLAVHTPRGGFRFLRQCYARAFRNDKLVVHRLSDIGRLFETHGLTTTAARCAEQRRDGTDYYIYLLSKPDKK